MKDYPTRKSFLSKFGADNIQRFCGSDAAAERCITGTAPSLNFLNIAYGEGSASVWLTPILAWFYAKRKVSPTPIMWQIEQDANALSNLFGKYKTTEVMLFLWRASLGFFGKFYTTDTDEIGDKFFKGFAYYRKSILRRWEDEQTRKRLSRTSDGAITYEEYLRQKGKKILPIENRKNENGNKGLTHIGNSIENFKSDMFRK